MADLADELLADLEPEEEEVFSSGAGLQQQQQQSNGAGHPDSNGHSAKSNGKRKAVEADFDDLEELGGDDDLDEEDDEDATTAADEEMDGTGQDGESKPGRTGTNPNSKHAIKAAEEMDEAEVQKLDLTKTQSIHDVSKMLRSARLTDTLAQIDEFGALETPDLEGVLEESPEYALIVRANNIAVDIDNEIMIAHKFVRDHYAPRFPELESLIHNPWEFMQAAQALGNEADMRKASLEGILPHSLIVVISMSASTTNGRPLDKETWDRVVEACQVAFDLEAARRKILAYVESRMTLIAPNLSALLGTRVATKLLGVSGGLNALGKIASCNLGLLGAKAKAAATATGLSTTFSGRHEGFISQCDLVANTPEEYRRQAQRMVSAKCALATRMDAAKSQRDGAYGRKLYDELSKKLEKLQEPPPSRMTKALPIPQENGKKQRRGGRQARARKAAYGMTELSKMQSRVEFGKEQEEVGAFDDIVGMGMINRSSTGKIRAAVGESRSKAKMSKRNINRINALRGPAGASALDSATAGTATSLSFTPVQGIELVDPSRNKAKVEEANAKWFKEGQFSLLPGVAGGSTIPGGSASGKTTSMAPPPLPVKKEAK